VNNNNFSFESDKRLVVGEFGFMGPAGGDCVYELERLKVSGNKNKAVVLGPLSKSIEAKGESIYHLKLHTPLVLLPHVKYDFEYVVKASPVTIKTL
jgi:hypothetical protein